METELSRNTPIFNDTECDNPDCIDGMVPEYTTNDMGEIEKEMVRCKCQR